MWPFGVPRPFKSPIADDGSDVLSFFFRKFSLEIVTLFDFTQMLVK